MAGAQVLGSRGLQALNALGRLVRPDVAKLNALPNTAADETHASTLRPTRQPQQARLAQLAAQPASFRCILSGGEPEA